MRRGMIRTCCVRCRLPFPDGQRCPQRVKPDKKTLGPAMIDLLTDPQMWIAFLPLPGLELVLGIDNIIFISILVDKLPPERRELARKVGLFLAMFMRVGLLLVLSWVVGLTAPLFSI